MEGTFEARSLFVRCKNPTCQRCQAAPAHGPYWYGFGYLDGKRVKFAYFGKDEPSIREINSRWRKYVDEKTGIGKKAKPDQGAKAEPATPPRFVWGSRMTLSAALRILDLPPDYTKKARREAFLRLVERYHPDKPARESKALRTEISKAINVAYNFLKARD